MKNQLTIAGGVYIERCRYPQWDRIFGSAGRAADAVAAMGHKPRLCTLLAPATREEWVVRDTLGQLDLEATDVADTVSFQYLHSLSTPDIKMSPGTTVFRAQGDSVLRYGMLEGSAVVQGRRVVYDPQNAGEPEAFSVNGSTADELALVLNRYEAERLGGMGKADPAAIAQHLIQSQQAAVVVIKLGAAGALVCSSQGTQSVPAFRTERVWKIGSGDTFAAHFALAWAVEGFDPYESAVRASRATAFYCETQTFPTPELLAHYQPAEVPPPSGPHEVYLAGPFFSMAQLWLVEEARRDLTAMGLHVFSPFHDVGPGDADTVVHLDLERLKTCDVVFAIADGMDPGTVFEVGYAKALGKPVVVYAENESDAARKMMEGSGCDTEIDYVTAIYKTLWAA